MNLFNKIKLVKLVKPVKPVGIMKINKNFKQKFVTHQQPEFALTDDIFFIYQPYQQPKKVVSGKVVGYKYIFDIDKSGNIKGELEYECTGEAAYYYKSAENNEYFKTEKDAQKMLDIKNAEKE